MAELIDVVDEADQPTGVQTTIAATHADATWHRIAAVFVFAPDGKLLVQVRNEPGYRRDHTVGGHVDAGETYEQAARREMIEEIGLDVDLRHVTSTTEIHSYTAEVHVAHHMEIFEADAPAEWTFEPNDEVADIVPMSLEEVMADMRENPDSYMYGFMRTTEAYIEARKG